MADSLENVALRQNEQRVLRCIAAPSLLIAAVVGIKLAVDILRANAVEVRDDLVVLGVEVGIGYTTLKAANKYNYNITTELDQGRIIGQQQSEVTE